MREDYHYFQHFPFDHVRAVAHLWIFGQSSNQQFIKLYCLFEIFYFREQSSFNNNNNIQQITAELPVPNRDILLSLLNFKRKTASIVNGSKTHITYIQYVQYYCKIVFLLFIHISNKWLTVNFWCWFIKILIFSDLELSLTLISIRFNKELRTSV